MSKRNMVERDLAVLRKPERFGGEGEFWAIWVRINKDSCHHFSFSNDGKLIGNSVEEIRKPVHPLRFEKRVKPSMREKIKTWL